MERGIVISGHRIIPAVQRGIVISGHRMRHVPSGIRLSTDERFIPAVQRTFGPGGGLGAVELMNSPWAMFAAGAVAGLVLGKLI